MSESYSHPRVKELDALLEADGVPLEDLREAFIILNKEVLSKPELVELMGAPEIGLVTKAAERLLDQKLETESKKKTTKKKTTARSAKGQIAAILKQAQSGDGDLELDEEDEWADL